MREIQPADFRSKGISFVFQDNVKLKFQPCGTFGGQRHQPTGPRNTLKLDKVPCVLLELEMCDAYLDLVPGGSVFLVSDYNVNHVFQVP